MFFKTILLLDSLKVVDLMVSIFILAFQNMSTHIMRLTIQIRIMTGTFFIAVALLTLVFENLSSFSGFPTSLTLFPLFSNCSTGGKATRS